MEKVEYPKDEEKLPEWTGCIDTCQVGCNKEGKLVAYDYGDL